MSTPLPEIIGVYLQPKRNLRTWRDRGVSVAFGRDREANTDGSDGVSIATWQASCAAVAMKYIVEPSADLKADARDPNRLGFLFPIDELDGVIINAQDAHDKAAEEAAYVGLETFYAKCKAAAPNMPVWVNVDANQVQYKRSDYARIFRECDKLSADFYPVQRGQPVTEYARLLDLIKTFPGGNKLSLAWIETSYQHLNPTYFPGKRGPTVAEWRAEVDEVLARSLSVGWFCQVIGEDGQASFNTDATSPDIALAMTAWTHPTATGAVSPAAGASLPLEGTQLTINGAGPYYLRSK